MPPGFDTVVTVAAGGGLVLTANKRLYRHLLERFEASMLERGRQVWSTPAIHSYEGWLQRCFQELDNRPQLLSPQQEHYLWEQQIAAAVQGSEQELLQQAQTAEKALQANRLLTEYELSLADLPLSEDQHIFLRWQQGYQERCRQQGWIDKSCLPRLISMALKESRLPLPAQVLLVGFDQLPPGLLVLQDCFRRLGCLCEQLPLSGDPAQEIIRFPAPDRDAEIETAARWAAALLQQGATSIGIVVPDLHRQRTRIERVFRDQIDPRAAADFHAEENLFSLSLGGPLAEQGVVHAALEFLNLSRSLELETLSFFLRNPYLRGGIEEADRRAQFESQLRSSCQQRYSLSRVLKLARREQHLSQLTSLLEKALENTAPAAKALPGHWAAHFADCLHASGWPGDSPLTSAEFQAVKAWQEKVLETLVTLDAVSPPIERSQALRLLRRLSQEVEFQLEEATGAVQVVGLLESAGLEFSHLWVMGLTDTQLPAPPRPNPFIPIQFQNSYAMPHANSARELEFARQVIERLSGAGRQLVLSHPRREGDCRLAPSPLISAWPEGMPQQAENNAMAQLQQRQRPLLEALADNRGPQLSQSRVEGGVNILKDQAHCPFRAFVHYRLKGRALEKPEPGLSARTRGELVHRALEALWRQLGDQQTLLSYSSEALETLIQEQVRSVFTAQYPHEALARQQLLQLERERVALLLWEWLETVDSTREIFQVLATEEPCWKDFGALQLRMQIDRIDRLENGSRVVIDYKTGSDLHAEDFLSDPLLEPQLPIYAVADPNTQVDGIAFAQVRRGHCRLLGVVREKGLLGRVKELTALPQAAALGVEGWPQLLHHWQQQIERLAADFAAGEAEVRPYDRVRSCRYCDLAGICRIGESRLSQGGGGHDC
jgi:probable DNA repair protein